jgi:hypothetical protein
MRIIETSHLEFWANSRSAQSQFPYYVKRLICAVISPEKLRIPSGDAVWIPGYDGVVINQEKNRFVPTGQSVWEIGTQPNITKKANKDYEKRLQDKKGKEEETNQSINRGETTFIFVTPRIWKNKDQWVKSHKAEGIWKEVIGIDGVDIQDWLEEAPAVSLQLAAEMALMPEVGLQTLNQSWEEWSQLTYPPISEELVITGREEQENNLVGVLANTAQTFIVRGDSSREALGFILAVLNKFTVKEKNQEVDARIIVADDEIIATQLQHNKNLIIILKQTRGQVSGVLSSKGHQVIIPEGNSVYPDHNTIELTRPFHHQFVDALKKMNLSDDAAEKTARECGLSITILQRRRAHANFKPPIWSDGDDVNKLLPAVLANRWDSNNNLDREILRQLADAKDYDNVEGQLQKFLTMDEPPLRRVNEVWTLSASADAFQLTACHITKSLLKRFRDVFLEVFGKIDPKVEIPLDDWTLYDIKRGERNYSHWLRSGLADSLLLIAERGENAHLDCISSPRAYVDEVVKGLPGLNDDWRVLASLRDQYARLMEAAPDPLLDSLEHMLEAKPDDVRHLFAKGDLTFGEHMYTGLLWGLETIAWSPEYLPRAALVLSTLASLDPGGRIQNRPINSLREIFLWWNPNTNANVVERLNTIDMILVHKPEIGWQLLSMLLPEMQSSSSVTAKPRWRDFGDLSEDSRTPHGQMQYVVGIGDRAIANVNSSPDRWKVILNSLRGLPQAQREKAFDKLKTVADGPIPADMKTALWNVLREFVYQQKTYQESNWTLPVNFLNLLETILPILAPSDLIDKNIWLFNEWLPSSPDGEENIDIRQEKVGLLRKQFIKDVLNVKGINGLVELGIKCEFPGFVATTAVPLIPSMDDLDILIERAISTGKKGVFLASHISAEAQQLHGEVWRDRVCKKKQTRAWSPSDAVSLVIYWPDEAATWEFVATLGIAPEYWKQKPFSILGGNTEEQVYQIEHLIEAGRSSQPFQYIANCWTDGVPTKTLVHLFVAAVVELAQAKTTDDINRHRLSSYDLQRFLSHLRTRGDLLREELARLEYQALPLLRLSDVKGLTLQEFMAEDSNFFVEVLCEAFLPAHRDKSKEYAPTDDEKIRGQVAYTLINGMSVIPGQHETEIDEIKLTQWVDAVREKAALQDRAVIADQQIGNILAHSQVDSEDKCWPHRSIRNLLEKLSSDEINLGLKIGRLNMRGVVSRSLYEGGVQERALASQYNEWAILLQTRWPKMSRVLKTMANEWEDQAKWEDTRAEQEKLE